MRSLFVCDRSRLICHYPQCFFVHIRFLFSQPRKVESKMAKAGESLDSDLCTLTLCIGRKPTGRRKVCKGCIGPLFCAIESISFFLINPVSGPAAEACENVGSAKLIHAREVTLLPLGFLIFKSWLFVLQVQGWRCRGWWTVRGLFCRIERKGEKGDDRGGWMTKPQMHTPLWPVILPLAHGHGQGCQQTWQLYHLPPFFSVDNSCWRYLWQYPMGQSALWK